MKKLQSYLIIIFLITLHSCSPKVRTTNYASLPTLDYSEEVKVIELEQLTPINSMVIGQVKIGNTGFTYDCDYYDVLETAKLEARKIGGNAIKINKHKLPSFFGGSCHRINADILVIDDMNFDEQTVKSNSQPFVIQLNEYDVIIRTNEKKVICIITNEDDDIVYFNINVDRDLVKTQLPRDQIKNIIYSKEHSK